MYKPIAKMVLEEGDNKYYWASVKCTNCDLNNSLAFKRGDLIADTACPNCENLTLIRVK